MTPRCTFRGCAVRWRDGGDRPCTEHAENTGPAPSAQAAAWKLLIESVPGDRDDDSELRNAITQFGGEA